MEFLVDLHVHCWSPDSVAEPEEIVRLAIERGLHGIAFTEHYFYGDSEGAEGLRERYRGRIAILRGVEFSAAEGHCLVFGVDTDRLVPRQAGLVELVALVNEAGGVAIPSHPYRRGSGVGDLVLRTPGLAALEGHNGMNMGPYNRQALAAAARIGVPCTGGSDAHLPGEVGSCVTIFPEPVEGESLVRLLRRGGYRPADLRGRR